MLCLSAPLADRNLGSLLNGFGAFLCLSAPLADRNLTAFRFGDSIVFVSAHCLQIATANVHKAPRADLWNAL